jgi:glycosyltransferase involved in cell wall biosynthesis
MPKIELLRAYLSVDCVIDQFVLPCIGSVTLEAIAVGKCPVITRLDDRAMCRFYGATIPLLNCENVQQIADAMTLVIEDANLAARVAEESRQWFDKHHSTEILELKLLEAIESCGSI